MELYMCSLAQQRVFQSLVLSCVLDLSPAVLLSCHPALEAPLLCSGVLSLYSSFANLL